MCVAWNVRLQPREIAHFGLGRGDYEERLFIQSRNRKVGFNAAALVEPLCIDQPTWTMVDVVCTNFIQYTDGITTLKPKLGER